MIDVSPVESSPCEDDTTVDMPLPGTQEDAPSCDGDEVDTALCDYVASLPGTQEGACSRDGDNNDTQHHTTGGVYQETNESTLSTKAEEPSEAISTHLYTLSEEYVDHTMYQMNGSYISENNHIVTSWIHMWCNKVIKHGKETLEKYPDRLKNCYPPTPWQQQEKFIFTKVIPSITAIKNSNYPIALMSKHSILSCHPLIHCIHVAKLIFLLCKYRGKFVIGLCKTSSTPYMFKIATSHGRNSIDRPIYYGVNHS